MFQRLCWLSGGEYIYDSSSTAPQCWISTGTEVPVKTVSSSTNVRSIVVNEANATVSIKIVPSDASIYFVEERVLPG